MELYNFFVIGTVLAYIATVTLLTKEFYRIIYITARANIHLYTTLAVAIIGVIKILFFNNLVLGDLYLFTPILYIYTMKLADQWTMKNHGRHVIMANKVNMAAKETKDAHFSDYAFFFMINFLPIITPIFIFESILGKG